MHFSTATIIAAAFFSSVSAAPAPDAGTSSTTQSHRINAVVKHLDDHNRFSWTAAPQGAGRVASIPITDVEDAHKALNSRSRDLEGRDAKGAAVGAWTNAGQLANYAASYACEQSGQWGPSTTIETQATDACKNLLLQVPGAVQADTAWHIYQAAANPSGDGGGFKTIYRWYYNTAKAPKLTSQICSAVYQKLTSDFCQGKGDNGSKTQGGEMKIGDGDDYLMVGMDPNENQ